MRASDALFHLAPCGGRTTAKWRQECSAEIAYLPSHLYELSVIAGVQPDYLSQRSRALA